MDLKNLYKQAQQMQNKMQKVQSDLEKEIIQGEAGGGAVIVYANCKGEIQKVKINKESIDLEDDIDILEDLILAAYNDVKKKADHKASKSMSSAGLPSNLMT